MRRKRCEQTFTLRKLHMTPAAVDLADTLGTMNITAHKQTIWKNAPAYRPYLMNIDNKLSCGMSSASILLYAMNSSTFTIRRKQEKSYNSLINTIFDDFFGRDWVGVTEFSFAHFIQQPSTTKSIQIHTNLNGTVCHSANASLWRLKLRWNLCKLRYCSAAIVLL